MLTTVASRLMGVAIPAVRPVFRQVTSVQLARTLAYVSTTHSGRRCYQALRGSRSYATVSSNTDTDDKEKEGKESVLDQSEPSPKEKTEDLIGETEKITGPAITHSFQADTKKLLDIVAKSLYSEKDVFVREIISNASDALEKLRYLQSTGQSVVENDLPLEIKISVDEKNNTFTIQDSGIGMTAEEMEKNLGTIAHSGSKAFLDKLSSSQEAGGNTQEGIIGQFGVGFYSTFMVANKVKVYSKSADTANGSGHLWESEGLGSYNVSPATEVQRGTKIIMHLKDDDKEFSSLPKIRSIVQNMSNFVGFPIKVNGEVVNKIQALWNMNPSDITTEMHNDFFRFISHEWTDPLYHLQYKTDVPLDIKSLFYIPATHSERMGMGRSEYGVSLYCRKILIQQKSKTVLPEWLRFVRGVVDSADIPLNLSRELLQDSSLLRRLNNIFTLRIIRFLEQQMTKDTAKYDKFFDNFGNFIREGVCTEHASREDISKLLRYESSTQEGRTTLKEYVSRMPSTQKDIYYITVPNRSLAETSPYMEMFKNKGIEVLYAYDNLDEVVMMNMGSFDKKSIKSVEASGVNMDDAKAPEISESNENLSKYITDCLKPNINSVKISTRLVSSPAIILDHTPAQMRKMLKMIDPTHAGSTNTANLEINPNHEIFVKLLKIKDKNPELANRVVHQIYDNAMIAAGLMEDPRVMLGRLNNLISDALDKSQ